MAFVCDSCYGNQATVECDVNNMADARAVNITWLISGPAMLYKRTEAVSPRAVLASELQRASLQNTEKLVDGQ
jgi:hypothetical protein